MIAYKRSKSLRDVLVRPKLMDRTSEGHAIIKGKCGPCNKRKCSWCALINKTSTFTGTRRDDKVFDIFHTVNCKSTLIHIIECRICRLQYIGKSETAFNLRLNNHRNHIKREESIAVNYQNTFSTKVDLTTLANTSQLRSLNKLSAVT